MKLVLGAIRLALSAIARSKLRAVLTIVGILIGVTAVVVVTALAGGASKQVGSQIDGFAANALFISPMAVQQSGVRDKLGRLTEADGRAIARDAVSVTRVAPWLSVPGQQVIYRDRNVATLIAGITLDYFPVRRFKVDRGVVWTAADETLKSKVCVIGQTVAEKLFLGEDPVGRTIRIGKAPFRVLGVLAVRGNSPFGGDQDDRIMMPIGSFRGHVTQKGADRVDLIMASASSERTTARASRQITQILRQRHHIPADRDPDFRVSAQSEFRKTQRRITDVLSGLLLAVAGVSLVVGGIGVMNIMLVSVAERTREIGIRMSVGARSRDILLQFLVEAVVLSLMGGLLGVGLGSLATYGLASALGWNTAPSGLAVALAVGTSAAIGVVFGILPARRAAHLDPIDALRTE